MTVSRHRRPRRDRHGRGLRGPLAPRSVPLARSQSDSFDAAVLDAVDHLQAHGLSELDGIEFAVEDVPPIPPDASATADGPYAPEVLDDAGVPLARVYPRGVAGIASPLIVLYRRPLESRALDPDDLLDIVHEVVVDRVAHLLGRDPGEIDPHLAD